MSKDRKNKTVKKQKIKAEENNPIYKYNQKKTLVLLSAILLLTIIVFSSSLSNDFTTWDDPDNVVDNPYIRDFSFSNIKTWFTKPLLAMYTPLVYLSYAIDYKIGGLKPFVYHGTNLLLHLLNVVLVFLSVRLLARRIEVAVIAALFFAIHPLNVAAIAPVSIRGTLLYSVFSLGAYLYYLQYLKGRDDKTRCYILSLALYLLSVLSKSAAVVLPLLLLATDYYYGRLRNSDGKFDFRVITEKIPFFAISVIFGILTLIFREDAGHIWSPYSFSLFERPFLIIYSLVFYIWKLFFPFNLSAYYTYPDNTPGYLPVEYYLSPLIILLIIFGIWKAKELKRDFVFGVFFYLINIILVLKIIPMGHENVCDRYAYLPNIGSLFIIGQAYSLVQDNKVDILRKIKPVFAALLVIAAVLFSILSYQRNTVWKDTFALFNDIREKYPDAAFVYNNIGVAKYNLQDYHGAIAEYSMAIELGKNYLTAYYNRGKAKEKLKDYEGAIKDYSVIIDRHPDPVVYNSRGLVKAIIQDYRGAVQDYLKAIELKPDYADVYNNLGLVKATIQDYKGAMQDYARAIELNHSYSHAYTNRGTLRAILQDFKGAIVDFNSAIKANPQDAEAYMNRGNANASMKDYYSAMLDYDKAISINPNHAGVYFNRGLVKVSLRNTSGACEDWRRASVLGAAQADILIKQYCVR